MIWMRHRQSQGHFDGLQVLFDFVIIPQIDEVLSHHWIQICVLLEYGVHIIQPGCLFTLASIVVQHKNNKTELSSIKVLLEHTLKQLLVCPSTE